MGRTQRMLAMVAVAVFAAPHSAMAATDQAVVIPDWLALGSGVLGLLMAIGLLVDAVLLRRVAEGSMIADNIVYMMLAVVCFGASMLARFTLLLDQFADVTGLVTLAADLLMTTGIALLTAYFYRVRMAMTRYVRSAQAYQEAAAKGEGEASV